VYRFLARRCKGMWTMARKIEKLTWSRKEIPAATTLSQRTVDSLLASGALPSIKVGKRILVTNDALLEFCKRGTKK
jgi:excisionase family DNA binding protein